MVAATTVADQVSKLQQLMVEQKAALDAAKAELKLITDARTAEKVADAEVKQEVDDLQTALSALRAGSHGGGSGGHGGPGLGLHARPPSAMKMDPCPSSTKELTSPQTHLPYHCPASTKRTKIQQAGLGNY